MSTESIQFALRERFAAPLPEFYRRRIIFWQDEDREFEATLDELDLSGVNIVKLTGTNNFAVKKLLLHDDLTGDYLVYNPFSYAAPQDDWLRDIELYSEEFRADYYSILMRELNIYASPVMRRTVKLYATFFGNKDRVAKLRRIGREYQTPLQLHIDIMAVLAGLHGGSAQDVFIAVLSAGLDEENNSVLHNIRKFGNIEAFWQLVRKYTGYIHEKDKPLGFFASHVLLTALTQTINPNVLKGLERFISESNKAYCYSIVHEWRNREDNAALWNLCRTVEQELQLPSRFDRQDIETLLTADIFPSIHEAVLKRFFSEAAEQVVKTDLILRTVENRRTSGWIGHFSYYYDCLYFIAKMQEFYQNNAAGFHIVEPKAVWKIYTEKAYEMDSFYRHFHYAFGCTLRDSNPLLEDKLKRAAEYTEGLYQNWYLRELTGCWTNAISENLAALGYVSGIGRQRDFYSHYVRPLAVKNTRAFVIISDALRYEVAAELCDTITRMTRGKAKIEAMQSVFPSITKFGMAALLPGKKIGIDRDNDSDTKVCVDDMPARTTQDREKILCIGNPNSIAVRYNDVLNMKRAERRKLVSGKEVVYIYHNTIDAIGDKASTESKVFEACEDSLQEISNILRIIVNDMQGTDIFITADHGFLYTYSPLAEGYKIGKDVIAGTVYETGRRYALTEPSAAADFLMPVRLEDEFDGVPIKGYTPQDCTRIRIPGSGENYVHGGVSLQELCVPVISFRNLRTGNRQYVEVSNAELKLLSESRRVSNLLFSLDFLQRQPVGNKVKPCVYTIYMTDEEGVIVSDRQTVIADRTAENASERVFRVRFSLKAGAYDSRKIYRLIIANDTDVPQEIEFHIDIAFADDFGFDL